MNLFDLSAFQPFNRGFKLSISSNILKFLRPFDLFIRDSWFHGNITTFSTFRRLNQWSKWLEACRMYSPRRYFSLHPGWLKLRLKIFGAILILIWFCDVVFVDISKQWPVCSTRGALTGFFLFSVPARSHAFYYIFIYYNAPRKTKPKGFLQFIFLGSPHKPKSKDFLQLIFLIF